MTAAPKRSAAEIRVNEDARPVDHRLDAGRAQLIERVANAGEHALEIRTTVFCFANGAASSRRTTARTTGRGNPVSPSASSTLSTEGMARRRDRFID